MARQLHLRLHDNTDGPRDWRLDEATRQLGFQGVANARAVLRAARTASRIEAEARAAKTLATEALATAGHDEIRRPAA